MMPHPPSTPSPVHHPRHAQPNGAQPSASALSSSLPSALSQQGGERAGGGDCSEHALADWWAAERARQAAARVEAFEEQAGWVPPEERGRLPTLTPLGRRVLGAEPW